MFSPNWNKFLFKNTDIYQNERKWYNLNGKTKRWYFLSSETYVSEWNMEFCLCLSQLYHVNFDQMKTSFKSYSANQP